MWGTPSLSFASQNPARRSHPFLLAGGKRKSDYKQQAIGKTNRSLLYDSGYQEVYTLFYDSVYQSIRI